MYLEKMHVLLVFWENSRSQTRPSFPLDHVFPTHPKKGLLYTRYFTKFLKHSPDEFFSPGLDYRKDAVGKVLADTGKTTPEDWKPMASFPHGAHAGFFAMVIFTWRLFLPVKIITLHTLLPGPVQ